MRIRTTVQRLIDSQAHWMADWLHSRWAFLQLVYGSLLWVPLVVLGIDGHGFLYLYIATTLSLITQVPLAMLSWWAAQEGRRNEVLMAQTLTNQTSMMEVLLDHGLRAKEQLTATAEVMLAMQAVLKAIQRDIDEQEEDLDESQSYLKQILQIAERAISIRHLREHMLQRDEHMHTVRGLIKALYAGLKDGGLPLETRGRIYDEVEVEFQAWLAEREEGDDLLRELD